MGLCNALLALRATLTSSARKPRLEEGRGNIELWLDETKKMLVDVVHLGDENVNHIRMLTSFNGTFTSSIIIFRDLRHIQGEDGDRDGEERERCAQRLV
jgi:hypothetical protein